MKSEKFVAGSENISLHKETCNVLNYVNKIIKKSEEQSYEPEEFHDALMYNRVLSNCTDTVWAQYIGYAWFGNDEDYQWKMHLFANSYKDWQRLFEIVLPVLIKQEVNFKTISTYGGVRGILTNKKDPQYGKVCTIYPKNEYEFIKVYKALNDSILTGDKAINSEILENFANINILSEKKLGITNRIFYRNDKNPVTGGYVSATESRIINPEKPYNPFNSPDPFTKLNDYNALSYEEFIRTVKIDYAEGYKKLIFKNKSGDSLDNVKNWFITNGIKIESISKDNIIITFEELDAYSDRQKNSKMIINNIHKNQNNVI